MHQTVKTNLPQIGNVELTFTSMNHICVTSEKLGVTLNRVPHTITLHYYFINGEWVSKGPNDRSYYGSLFIRRAEWDKEPSQAAKKKAIKLFDNAIPAFVQGSQQCQIARYEAEKSDLEHKVKRAEEDLKAKKEAVIESEMVLDIARIKLNELLQTA